MKHIFGGFDKITQSKENDENIQNYMLVGKQVLVSLITKINLCVSAVYSYLVV
jgi:hypothetical protein